MSHPRPFRFGLLGENVRSAKELVDTAHRAEEAGFATFLLRDHFIAEPFGHQLAPLAALATVAAGTTRLRVGTMVLCNDYRHPVRRPVRAGARRWFLATRVRGGRPTV